MPKTHTIDVKDQFIELRAKGNTFSSIAEQLDVSKPTLIEWAKEFQFDIENRKALEIEALQQKYFATWEQRLEFLGTEFEKINEEIQKRDYAEMSKKELYEVALKLQTQLKEMLVKPTLKIKLDSETALMKQLEDFSSVTQIEI